MINYDELPCNDILTIDVKSFFASVEAVRRRIHPLYAFVIVVANKNRSGAVVLAASPKVKELYGIKTGSRQYMIPKHDPRIIVVEPSMSLYLKVNEMIIEILRRYAADEDILVYSIDEMLVNVTPVRRLHGDKWTVAKKIQTTIWKELRLVVTIGIGDNPLLSKLALDNEAKKAPNGLAYWSYKDVPSTIWKITDLTDVWGISSGYKARLNNMGIYTMYDLAHADRHKLKDRLGILGLQLYYHAWGVDYTILSEGYGLPKEKTFSKGQVLMRDYTDLGELFIIIQEMVDEVAARLRKHHVSASKISLSISYTRDIEERGFAHQVQLDRCTNNTMELTSNFKRLFQKHWKGQPVRQVNISCGKLSNDHSLQLDLFTSPDRLEKSRAIDDVMDEIRRRFGKSAIFRAYSLQKGGTFLKKANYIGGHKS